MLLGPLPNNSRINVSLSLLCHLSGHHHVLPGFLKLRPNGSPSFWLYLLSALSLQPDLLQMPHWQFSESPSCCSSCFSSTGSPRPSPRWPSHHPGPGCILKDAGSLEVPVAPHSRNTFLPPVSAPQPSDNSCSSLRCHFR